MNSQARARGILRAALLAALLPGLGLLAPAGAARDYHYGALAEDALLSCEALYWTGERNEANQCYRDLLGNSAMPPRARAEALWAMGDLKGANTQFQRAVESQPEDPGARLRWGELFLQTYQYQEALNLFEEALSLDPGNPHAHLGAAEALSEGGGDGVNEHIAAVMNTDASPAGARLRALLKLSHSAMEQDQLEQAGRTLAEARKLVEGEELFELDLLALEAAHAFLSLADPRPFIDRALALNPGFGDAWAVPGYFATITRRYTEAGEFYAQAVRVQPDHWEAHLELGQNHLRQNRVNEAVEHVTLSYDGDPFNPKAVNTLRLLDTFVNDFVLVSYPDPPQDGLPDLTLRLHREERDVLKPYARELAEASIETFSERYRFEPREPIVVELYPNHEDFVVRSIGMPGVGILGVTFGYLFAMDSPSGHPEESYHWGTTLWHEMAHVFTLAASDHFVPRWFSEGVSVFEEWRTGPIPGVRIPVDVLRAMADDKFLPVAELDDGFMRPSYDGQVMVSYMQSGLVFEFIDIEYGFDRIVDMLHRFREGIRAEEAIEASLGIDIEDFDKHFRQFIDQHYGQLLGNLDSWLRDYQAAFRALQAEDWEDAVAAAERAIALYPDYVEHDSPYLALARARARLGEGDREFEALHSFWRHGGYAPSALMRLGNLLIERERGEEAVEVFRDLNYVAPFDERLHQRYGDLLLELERPREALREFEVLLALDPLDKAGAHLRLARAWQALEDEDKSMDYLMQALDIAPQYRPAQRMLLELSRNGADQAGSGDQ